MKKILQNILAILNRKEKKQFFILLLLDITINIIDIVSLAFLLWIIRFYIEPGYKSSFTFMPAWLADKRSVMLIAVFAAVFSLKNWIGFLITQKHFTFIGKVAIRISHFNLLNYQQAGFDEFVNTDSSVHIRNICFQPFDFAQYMLSGVQQIVTQLSLIGITIIAIILFNVKLFLLLLLLLLPPVVVVFYIIKKRLAHTKKNIQVTNESSFRYLLDALKGYVESNIYQRNDFFLKRFIEVRRKFSNYLFDSLTIQTMPGRIIEIFAVLGLFILIVIARWLGNNDSATLITIGAFMAAAYKIIPGIVKVINVSGQIKTYELLLDELKEKNSILQTKPITKTFAGINSIAFSNISFQYQDQPVLQGVSFTIENGDFLAITGESGRGKTTILNLLLGFLPAGNGDIIVNKEKVNAADLKNCWPYIAYVRQQNFFIHDTVIKNITLEEDNYNKEKLQQALRISGVDKVIAKFPEGNDKVISENGKNISGGQQQRIALARALYKNATLILLDEPFNELDEEATLVLLEHFRELAFTGKIIIMITHDKKCLAYCNKIIALDGK